MSGKGVGEGENGRVKGEGVVEGKVKWWKWAGEGNA